MEKWLGHLALQNLRAFGRDCSGVSGTLFLNIAKTFTIVLAGFSAGCAKSQLSTGAQNNTVISKNSFVLSNIKRDFAAEELAGNGKGRDSATLRQSTSTATTDGFRSTAAPSLTGTYAKIAAAAKTRSTQSSKVLITSAENKLSAHRQKLLPQVTPGASIDEQGKALAEINVDQVLFDSGRYNASKGILLSQRDEEMSNLALKEQEQANKAIGAYIGHHHSLESRDIAKEISLTYQKFERQSQSRLKGGIGGGSDLDLFNLKKLEAKSELVNHTSEANEKLQEFQSLTGLKMPKSRPTRLKAGDTVSMSPDLTLAIAKRDRAAGELDLERANRLPKISIVGNVGMNPDGFVQDRPDVRMKVSLNKPLTWGQDHGLTANHQVVEAQNLKIQETMKETRDNLLLERLKVAQNEKKLRSLSNLLKSANKRLRGFNSRFLAGKAGMRDVVGIVDAYKRIRFNVVNTKYAIHRSELQIAYLSGSL